MGRFFLSIAICITACSGGQVLAGELTEIRFVGNLSRSSGDEQLVLRDFEALLIGGDLNFFSVFDDEKDGCPWPESYGTVGLTNGPQPHLVFLYDEHTYTLPLPELKLDLPERPAVGSEWTAGNWSYEITDDASSDQQNVFIIEGQERRGRRQKVTVDSSSGLLVSAEMDVFMGQGDKFNLLLKQASNVPIAADAADNLRVVVEKLNSLQSALGRRTDSQQSELSSRQIEKAAESVADLSAAARGTLLNETVLRISRDVASQQRRAAQTMQRERQLLNTDAPGFSLNLISGVTLESESLAGKAIVLHFWNYSDKPLAAPYGQVGYLQFLMDQRKDSNVVVVGVATNKALQQAEQNRGARRSARKLAEFMNLSYQIGYDNGSLLRELGDPRDSGADLPLWVVISPEGKVVHYHAGCYEVNGKAGLKELVTVLDQQKP